MKKCDDEYCIYCQLTLLPLSEVICGLPHQLLYWIGKMYGHVCSRQLKKKLNSTICP